MHSLHRLLPAALRAALFSALALGVPFGASTLRAQDPAPAEGGDKGKEGDEKKDEEKDAKYFAVIGGDVYTGTGALLRGATVLSRNGKIKDIGYDLDLPPDTKTLDATGYRVYPGLVSIASQGLIGNASGEFDDTIDPFNSRMTLALANGITSTGVANSAVKLKRFSVKGSLLRDKVFSTFSWSGRNPGGKKSLRDKFAATSEYLRAYREWEEKVKKDKELKEPAKKNVDIAVLSVLKGETQAKFNANERDDLLGIARLSQEYGFRPVIEGCTEGWTIADELGRAGAEAIITPRERRAKDEQLVREGGASITNAAVLYKAGVPIAVVPATQGVDLGGIVGRDIMCLNIEADFAVRGGLSEDAALASITIVPARMLGISHRVGSLEKGKDCDLIVTDGDILHYNTWVQWTVVDGKLVYDKEKELFFAQIRPRPAAQAPAKKLDKGETEVKPDAKDGEKSEDKPKDDKDKPKEGDKSKDPKDGDKPKKDG